MRIYDYICYFRFVYLACCSHIDGEPNKKEKQQKGN